MTAEKDHLQEEGPPKLGLALSGGGFRASFFHLGVLAQMARLGLLRQVEVLSTVSGGSIIGALYYLHVKQLLEEKSDHEITDQDYLALMEKMEAEFLRAVQNNLRTRTFADFKKNLWMFRSDYSRSDRIGELYDEFIYSQVMPLDAPKMVQMQNLMIFPKKADGSREEPFDPASGNASRQAKVPVLLLNATTLNTGHNWRFEAKRMGEPPRQEKWEQEVDKNARLERGETYQNIVLHQQTMELGLAVAASACVPGVFQPLALSGLYPDFRPQLADGGVVDNQGIQALLDLQCTQMIVSDACGQMQDDPEPGTLFPQVLLRSNSVLMERVRQEQLLRILEDPNLEVAFIHLRKGLAPPKVPLIGPGGQPSGKGASASGSGLTSFGVSQAVQERLAKVRTDLDSFTDVEAYSLMLDGYLMSSQVIAEVPGIQGRQRPPSTAEKWQFLDIKPWMQNPTPDYLEQLEVASQKLLKVFRLDRRLTAMVVGALLALVLLVSLPKLKTLLFVLPVIAALVYPKLRRWILDFLKMLIKTRLTLILRGLLAVIAWGLARVHLKYFDHKFLEIGRLKNLQPPVDH